MLLIQRLSVQHVFQTYLSPAMSESIVAVGRLVGMNVCFDSPAMLQ